MFKLKELKILGSRGALAQLPDGKLLINTINAHSYNTARKDPLFAEALAKGDVLIPDGVSIVKACRWIKAKSQPKERIAGWDLFSFEMERLEELGMRNEELGVGNEELGIRNEELGIDSLRQLGIGNEELGIDTNNSKLKNSSSQAFMPRTTQHSTFNTQHSKFRRKMVMFMGSSEHVLDLIVKRAAVDYPHLKVVTYSPPYKKEFSDEENRAIIDAINRANPDLLWIGMTAPKQEKWTYSHWNELNIHCHVGTIGAVFDFYAGTVKRAPEWWQQHGVEWLYRLMKEPRRMWRRYIIGNALFLLNMLGEKIRG